MLIDLDRADAVEMMLREGDPKIIYAMLSAIKSVR
jgi:hypothetical protein